MMDKGILRQAYSTPQTEVFKVRIERTILSGGGGGQTTLKASLRNSGPIDLNGGDLDGYYE